MFSRENDGSFLSKLPKTSVLPQCEDGKKWLVKLCRNKNPHVPQKSIPQVKHETTFFHCPEKKKDKTQIVQGKIVGGPANFAKSPKLQPFLRGIAIRNLPSGQLELGVLETWDTLEICQQTLDVFFHGKVCGKTLFVERLSWHQPKKKRFILVMEEIRLTSWDGKNIPFFTGFHTYWVVSRISEPSTVDESTYNTNGIWCKWRVSWCNCGCYSPCEGIEWNTWSPPLMFYPNIYKFCRRESQISKNV